MTKSKSCTLARFYAPPWKKSGDPAELNRTPLRTSPSRPVPLPASNRGITTIIDAAASPANIEIRPPRADGQATTDLEVATAKRLAGQLADAGVIEEAVRDKIIRSVSPQVMQNEVEK